jgi:iron-only hydrogenase group A
MIKIKINDKIIESTTDKTILEVAKENNIQIPTLCYYPDLDIKSDCRICVVEIEGQKGLVTSCSTYIQKDMSIKTNSPRVLNARKTITELILSNHDANCTACVKNLNCELQSLANKLGIDENRFEHVLNVKALDDHNPSILRNLNRCIKCGRCVDVCKNIQGINVLESMNRSHDMEITPAYGKFLSDESCTFCGQCASVCPVAAITEKDDTHVVWEALHDDNKHVIVQVAPAVRVSLGDELGYPAGEIVTEKMVTALKMLGFDRVFDTDFTADLTIIEEGHELIHRIQHQGTLPMITSCCPGWISFAEQYYPEILPHLSSCKSPQQMFGALAKSYYAKKENIPIDNLVVVSIMPCTAKKYEAKRNEMKSNPDYYDVDYVLTTRELGKMIKQMGIHFEEIEMQSFDSPFGITTGAAVIFGATGGVMEAALRTVSEVVNQTPLDPIDFKDVRGLKGIKEAEITLNNQKVKIAVAHTLANAKVLAEQVKNGTSEYAFIEIMACPGGCIGGGGQPYNTTKETRLKRIDATYRADEASSLRKSHENPAIVALYQEFLKEPLGHHSHELLHTTYKKREKR